MRSWEVHTANPACFIDRHVYRVSLDNANEAFNRLCAGYLEGSSVLAPSPFGCALKTLLGVDRNERVMNRLYRLSVLSTLASMVR